MRSAILIFLAILAVATTPARAQGTWVETRFARAICGGGAAPVANTDGLAKRLKLTDPQKAALKDLADASASADASAKKTLCADKPDLSTTPGRMAFAAKMAETRLAGIPFDWLLLGAGIYPVTGISAWLYIRSAARNEARYRDLAGEK